jgi:hypothetical protein
MIRRAFGIRSKIRRELVKDRAKPSSPPNRDAELTFISSRLKITFA